MNAVLYRIWCVKLLTDHFNKGFLLTYKSLLSETEEQSWPSYYHKKYACFGRWSHRKLNRYKVQDPSSRSFIKCTWVYLWSQGTRADPKWLFTSWTESPSQETNNNKYTYSQGVEATNEPDILLWPSGNVKGTWKEHGNSTQISHRL